VGLRSTGINVTFLKERDPEENQFSSLTCTSTRSDDYLAVRYGKKHGDAMQKIAFWSSISKIFGGFHPSLFLRIFSLYLPLDFLIPRTLHPRKHFLSCENGNPFPSYTDKKLLGTVTGI
jgi:hypothetical protein